MRVVYGTGFEEMQDSRSMNAKTMQEAEEAEDLSWKYKSAAKLRTARRETHGDGDEAQSVVPGPAMGGGTVSDRVGPDGATNQRT